MTSPDSSAKIVIRDLAITSPRDLDPIEHVAWARGALVQEKILRGAEARLVAVGDVAVISVSASTTNPRRRRFSIAHELGHLEMHCGHQSMWLCAGQDINDWEGEGNASSFELEANQFAAALLMPEPFFAPPCIQEDPSLDLIMHLSERFNVSLTAAALRFILFCDEAGAIVFSQDNYIKWFRRNEQFEELGLFADVKSKVYPASLAARFFRGQSIPTGARRIEASDWCKPGRYPDDATILEYSVPIRSQNAVLTLLWADEEFEEEDDDA